MDFRSSATGAFGDVGSDGLIMILIKQMGEIPCSIDCPPWDHNHKVSVNDRNEMTILSMSMPKGRNFHSLTEALLFWDVPEGEELGVLGGRRRVRRQS